MLQIIRAIMKDPKDKTICYLLFANQVSHCPFGQSSLFPINKEMVAVDATDDWWGKCPRIE